MSAEPKQILVVGAGIIGTSTAYFLAREAASRSISVQVKVLEGTRVAAGASGNAGGLLALDWHHASTSSLAALSYQLHKDLAAEFGGSERWGYRTLDTLSVSADLSSSQASAARRHPNSSTDARFAWLNKDKLRETSVLGTQETTAQVHPRLFTESLAEEATKLGVELVEGTASTLKRDGDRIVVGTSTGSSHECTQLVICAGPWTGRLLKQLGLGSQGRASRIDGSRAHSVVIKTAPGKDLPAQALFTAIKENGGMSEPEIYNRPDGTAYACGPTDNSSLPESAADVKVVPSAIDLLLAQTAQLSPDYLAVHDGGATVAARQACYLPVGSGDPVIGKLRGAAGVYVGAGHSCWGITNGPATGLCLAELILDGKVKSANIDRLGI